MLSKTETPRFLIHRMQATLTADDQLLTDDLLQVRGYNCKQGGCTDMMCREACCTMTGISVILLQKTLKFFYDSHVYLYKLAMRSAIASHLRNIGNIAAAEDVLRSVFNNTMNKVTVDKFVEEMERRTLQLPECRVCRDPPGGTRVYVDQAKDKNHFHGLLQPLHAMSLTAYEDIAMANGPHWTRCPYFVAASGENIDEIQLHPQDRQLIIALRQSIPGPVADFELPCPDQVVAQAMITALNQLLKIEMLAFYDCLPKRQANIDLLTLARCIVHLSKAPDDLLDPLVSPECSTVPVPLARLLLTSLRRGYFSSIKAYHNTIVYAIANSLGMDAGDVYYSDPLTERSDELTERSDGELNVPLRSIVFYGDLVPHNIQHGQHRDLINALDSAASHALDDSAASHALDDSAASDFDKRIDALQDGHVTIKCSSNEGTNQNVSLKRWAKTRFLHDQHWPDSPDVELDLHEFGNLLSCQTPNSVTRFMSTANGSSSAMDLKNSLSSLEKLHGSTFVNDAAIFKRHTGTVVAASGSVIAVFESDDTEGLQEISNILKEKNLIANFLAVYLSCKLRIVSGNPDVVSLPLATHALMVLPTTNGCVDTDVADVIPNYIQPPMPHNLAYCAIINPNRSDIHEVQGVELALQIAKGVRIVRSVCGARSSFIVWFLKHPKEFSLADAMFRENNSRLDMAACKRWARQVTLAAQRQLEKGGLIADEDGTLRLSELPKRRSVPQPRAQRFIIITWNNKLHKRAKSTAQEILSNSHAALNNFVAANITFPGIHDL